MATYLELNELNDNGLVRNKIAAAVAIAAHAILDESVPVQSRIDWANEAIVNPDSKVEEMVWYLLAANKGLTKVQIEGASDSSVQSAVDDAISKRVAAPA